MKTKKQNGITLIALVVTIIILLILAAVTTSFVLSDNGIFNKAAGAVRRHIIADEKEQITMAFASCRMQLIQNRITVSVVDTKKYAAISSGSSNEENEVQETNNTVDTPLDDEDLVTAPMLQRALNGSKEDTDSKIALVTSNRTKYELDVEFTKTHNQYTVSARNGEFLKVPDAEISVDGQQDLADLTAYFNSGENPFDYLGKRFNNVEPIMDASTSMKYINEVSKYIEETDSFEDKTILLYKDNLYTFEEIYSGEGADAQYVRTDVEKLNINVYQNGLHRVSGLSIITCDDVINNKLDVSVEYGADTNRNCATLIENYAQFDNLRFPSITDRYNPDNTTVYSSYENNNTENVYYFDNNGKLIAKAIIIYDGNSNFPESSSVNFFDKDGKYYKTEELNLDDSKYSFYDNSGNLIKYYIVNFNYNSNTETTTYTAQQYNTNDQQVGESFSNTNLDDLINAML